VTEESSEGSREPATGYLDQEVPPLRVPPRLAYALEAGACLGPPSCASSTRRPDGSEACTRESNDGLTRSGLLGASQVSGEDVDWEDQPNCSESRNFATGNAWVVDQLVEAFTEATSSGVGVSLAIDDVGVLLVEVRFRTHPFPQLRLKFDLVERVLPLSSIEEVQISRNRTSDTGGAWLVRLQVPTQAEGFCFVFDGTDKGQAEAHYLGGCLRVISRRARSANAQVSKVHPSVMNRRAPSLLPHGGNQMLSTLTRAAAGCRQGLHIKTMEFLPTRDDLARDLICGGVSPMQFER